MNTLNTCVYCKTPNDSKSLYGTRDIFGDFYSINQCNVCRAFFLSPNPTPEQLSRAYDDSYYGQAEEKFTGFFEKVLDFFRRKRALVVSKNVPVNGNILDIGCGNGRFLKYLLEYGTFNLYGIEMPGIAAERASKIQHINLKIGQLEEGDYPDNFFDAITLFHVFEHLPQPFVMLQLISRFLKTDGVCIMSFPNIGSIQSRLFKGNWLHLDPPRHLFYFEANDFERIISDHGFYVEKISYLSLEQNPFGMIQSILNYFTGKREILYESLKGNKAYTRDVSPVLLFFQSMFFRLSFPIFALSDVFESLLKKGATVQYVLRKK